MLNNVKVLLIILQSLKQKKDRQLSEKAAQCFTILFNFHKA